MQSLCLTTARFGSKSPLSPVSAPLSCNRRFLDHRHASDLTSIAAASIDSTSLFNPLRISSQSSQGFEVLHLMSIYKKTDMQVIIHEGLLKQEGKERYGASFRQWQIDAPNFLIDGHYPVRARGRNCWDRILAHESRFVLVVAHNVVNQALVASALGLGTEYFRVLHIRLLAYVFCMIFRHGADVDVEDKEEYTVLGRASADFRMVLVDASKTMLEG